MIIVIIALSVALNMTGLVLPPEKKEEVVLKAQVVDLKGQAVIGNPNLSDGRSKISVPKFDNDNDNAELTTKTKTFTVY